MFMLTNQRCQDSGSVTTVVESTFWPYIIISIEDLCILFSLVGIGDLVTVLTYKKWLILVTL